ncbi:transposase, partial [Yersinia enterocolitica]|nr:transposase [Yersinia enterocolitica]
SKIVALTPATTIAMEACGGSHFMVRKLTELGHFPKLISPQFVRPFVKTNMADWVRELLCRKSNFVVTCTLANKLARIA